MKMKATSNDPNIGNIKNEIEAALTGGGIEFEEIPGEEVSPLNQPVVEKNFANDPVLNNSLPSAAENDDNNKGDAATEEENNQEPLDAPEQEINAAAMSSDSQEDIVEIPLSHAQMAADTFLGVADNMFEVGAGFFVTIKKHEDFYDFDEVLQVIEDQNVKNVKRLKLDDDDKALLRPLLIVIIRKRAKTLTPEQQLLAAALSILVKKAKIMIEIRMENKVLVDRIREIIQEEKTGRRAQTHDEGNKSTTEEPVEVASVMEVAE